jgi:hypothetical protein
MGEGWGEGFVERGLFSRTDLANFNSLIPQQFRLISIEREKTRPH